MTPEELTEFLQRVVDEGFISQVYRLASVNEAEVLNDLRTYDVEIYAIEDIASIATHSLDACADKYTQQARRMGALAGVTYGAGGLLTALPELAHLMVSVVRTAQKLSLTYGQEFESFRGGMQLWEAIGEAFGVDPSALEGAEGSVYSNLPVSMVRTKGMPLDPVTIRIAQKVLLTIALPLAGRWARLVPIVGIGVSGVGNYALLRVMGHKLKAVFRQRHQVRQAASNPDSQTMPFTLVS